MRMVSICGGEPLIYPHIEALVNGLLDQGRIVYVCTNAMFMRKKMREWLTKELRSAENASPARTRLRSELEAKVDDLLREGLISEKDAAAIRNPQSTIRDHVIGPSKWMYWNVHLDGLERTHDLIVERKVSSRNAFLPLKWRNTSAIRWRPTRPSTRRPTWMS